MMLSASRPPAWAGSSSCIGLKAICRPRLSSADTLITARQGTTGRSNSSPCTTMIAMIMGLVQPTSGTVEVLGHKMPDEAASVLGRMNFESPYVDMPMRLTVRQNLTIFGRLYAVDHLKERIEELASQLDLTD